jgi:DNA polymerase III alpha subunit
VYERFGQDRVAMVCTINRFRRRSALREVSKAHGLSPQQIKALADHLPRRGWGPPDHTKPQEQPYEQLERAFRSPLHHEIFSDAKAILGIPRHLSIHPGGMVIAPGPITDLVPTQMASKGVLITQFDLEAIEQMGLVKIELLERL